MPEPETFPGSLVPLLHPDPEPDDVPMLAEGDVGSLQTETASHLVRAITRMDDRIAEYTKRMLADASAWQQEIAKLQTRRENWRDSIRHWMEMTGTFKLQTPWVTCSLSKGRSKIVVDDEAACIKGCRAMKADSAVKVIEKLDKKEFDIVWNSTPRLFEGAAGPMHSNQ